MAAAPADFRAAEVAAGKLKREGPLELRLEPTEDILAGLATTRAEGQTIVGFAAEHGEGGVERARAKLERKGADLIVLNDVSDPAIGFESEENAVTLLDESGETAVPRAPKDAIADSILDRVDQLRTRARGLY
jgi:phosphopantothenoylcysteine decarboxylase/phosphopantothenate--cysteine ligase